MPSVRNTTTPAPSRPGESPDRVALSAAQRAEAMAEIDRRAKAARDLRRATRKAAQAAPSATPTDERLGTTGETATLAGQRGSTSNGAARRDARYSLREGLWRVTEDKGLKGCGRSALGGGVAPVLNGGVAHFAGLVTCGKIHLCPVCSAKIRATRAEEIDTACAGWESAGRGVAMMTLTLRHYRRMPLGTLRKRERSGLVAVQHDAWITAFGNRAGKMWQQLQTAYGVEGYVRVWECTQGGNGWHPHFHVLMFLAKPWTAEEAADFEKAARARWVRSVEKAGGYRPNDRGCRVDLPQAGDAGQFGRYLFKNQDGKARFGKLGQELARGDMKTGRQGSRMPFEVAQGAADGIAEDVPLWREYETGAHGVRAMYWSNGMRAKLAEVIELDERSDEEIAAEEVGGDTLALIPTETWYAHVVRHRGRPLALLKAAEAAGGAGVRSLIESWGLVWGRDVLPAPESRGADQD